MVYFLLEKYPSGRRGQFRKLLGDASLAWVQIPFSPPKVRKKPSVEGFYYNLLTIQLDLRRSYHKLVVMGLM